MLNLDGWFLVSSNKLIIFWYSIILLYYGIDRRLSKFFCLSFRNTYFSLSIAPSFVFELFCGKFFETLVILSAILFPIKSVASAVSWIALLEVVLSASAADCLAW